MGRLFYSPPSTTKHQPEPSYKGERESDPLSSLLTSRQDAVKGGDHFGSMGWRVVDSPNHYFQVSWGT